MAEPTRAAPLAPTVTCPNCGMEMYGPVMPCPFPARPDPATSQAGASVEGRTGEAIRQGFHRQEQMNPGDNRG